MQAQSGDPPLLRQVTTSWDWQANDRGLSTPNVCCYDLLVVPHLPLSLHPYQARRTIRKVSAKLISNWRSAHPVTISADATGLTNGTAAAAAPLEAPMVEEISATVPTDVGTPADATGEGGRDQAERAAAAAPAPAGPDAGVKKAKKGGVEPGVNESAVFFGRGKGLCRYVHGRVSCHLSGWSAAAGAEGRKSATCALCVGQSVGNTTVL